ncbi:MAG TPA: glycogen/starch synthase [Gemmatimonadales bacterium]|nr:glycogen/starch synthase [Gemmatimonadales bacterium]HZH41859.1 glycogen/starch synthase [Gemmatimonadales bacterium]
MAVKQGTGTRAAGKTSRARVAAPRRTSREPPIGVVHLAAECWPFARTGGLGEAVSGLAAAQAALGNPTTIVMPLYQRVRETTPALERTAVSLAVPLGLHAEHAWLYRLPRRPGSPDVFFVEHPDFFDRPGIYGDNAGDYDDNARRFAFFCRAALAALPEIAPEARVLHAHDWHTALAPLYLRTALAGTAFYDRLGVVLAVHNAAFQGHFPPEMVDELGLPSELYRQGVLEWYGRMNFLQGGLAFADLAVTVSPTHAAELRTPEGGFGLQGTFTALGDRLVGILNGIDPLLWDPAADPEIPSRYSREDPSGKRHCKAELQKAYGLAVRPDAPLFAMSARMVSQKGLDLVLGADLAGSTGAQFVFLGAGEHRYHQALTELAAGAPDRVAVEFMFTDRVEHRLLAGADALLMPSLYEPCGLTQMRAQHYGAIPVARRVGGLSDSIEDGVTGFLFDAYEPAALAAAIHRTTAAYDDRAAWKRMVRAAMGRQFGWDRSAERYRAVYVRALNGVV